MPAIDRTRLMAIEPYLAVAVALHGALLLFVDSVAPAYWAFIVGALALALVGRLGLVSRRFRSYGLLFILSGIALATGGITSSITAWFAVAALVYAAVLVGPPLHLVWSCVVYLPLVAVAGSIVDAVVRAALVVGAGAVVWGLGIASQEGADRSQRAELELRDVRVRFAAAFEHSSTGMVMFDKDGRILLANQALADFLARPVEELSNASVSEIFHPDDHKRINSQISSLADAEVWSFQDEVRCVHADGRVMAALVGIGLVTDGVGAAQYFFAHIQDISARVASEESLRSNEEHYRGWFGQSPIPMWEVDYTAVASFLADLDGVADLRSHLSMRPDIVRSALALVRLGDANEAAVHLSGTAEVAERHPGFPLDVDETSDALVDQLVAVAEGTGRAQGDITVAAMDGLRLSGILHWAAPTIDGHRDLSRVMLAFADFTEARQAQVALRRIEERLRAVVSAAPILLFALDADGVFTLSEGQALQSLRLSPGEAVGRSAFELFRDSPDLIKAVRRALSGDSFTTSAEVRTRMLDFRLGPMWESGQVAGVIGVGNDVTERTQVTKHLEQLVRSKDQFVASVSHELRTPLTAVVGFAQELDQGLERFEEPEVKMLVHHIAQQSGEVADLVEDLLVASRSDVDSVSIELGTVDLWEQVDSVLAAWPSPEADAVARDGDPVKLVADDIRLRQILRNLLSNARRYGGDSIVVSAARDGEVVRVEIRDDGDGIPERDRSKIFDPYFRREESVATDSAVGLGLTVSYQLAQLMDGDLAYRYENGCSVFALTLPAE